MPRATRKAHGFSLVELMVAMAIGMVLVLAITVMLARGQGAQRTLSSTSDADQNGAYVAYLMDRLLRSAGSGYSQQWAMYGCSISAARSGTTILPVPSAERPSEFATIPVNVRLAPLIVHADAASSGSDVLAVITGASGLGEAPLSVQNGSLTSTGMRLQNTLGIRGNDLVLMMEPNVGCMVQQVTSSFTGSTDQQLTLGGTYYTTSVTGGAALASFGVNAAPTLAQLGNATGNTPQMQWIGVGANDTLYTYDLLRLDGVSTSTPLAEGVADLRAIYGLDTDGNGTLDTWQDPGVAPYDAATLLNGTPASAQRLRNIVAVRIGLILRTPLVEKASSTASSLTLFSSLGASLTYTRNLTTTERLRRHRVVEFTVPLRNNLLL